MHRCLRCVCVVCQGGYLGAEVLLQAAVPGLLYGGQAVTKRFLSPPEDVIGDQAEALEGVPEKVLLHAILHSATLYTHT